MTLNQRVQGSSPCAPTNKINHDKFMFLPPIDLAWQSLFVGMISAAVMGCPCRIKVHGRIATSDRYLGRAAARRQDARHIKQLGPGRGVLPGEQVLEVRNVDGRLHVARKERRHDQWDLPVERYDPYTPGKSNDFDVITDDASLEVGDASPSDE